MHGVQMETIEQLVAACLALGAEDVSGWSEAEKELANTAAQPVSAVNELRAAILAGMDPLGDAFCRIRSAEDRRPQGQTYTPAPIVNAMIAWTLTQPSPARVVDPGVGSARFLLAAATAHPDAELIGADLDPIAGLMARANLATAGHSERARIELIDYRSLNLPKIEGTTAYVGNPPYVRHHGITPAWKKWLTATSQLHGYKASQLAGLHVHFFLATLSHARTGDYGTFVTSSEWLDVNYGSLVRQLLVDGLGGESIHVVDPTALPFSDAATTAAITCYQVGKPVESIRMHPVKSLDDLGKLSGGQEVARQRLVEAPRWSPLLRTAAKLPDGYVELGELARVHRGTVTGANRVWVQHRGAVDLPHSVLMSSVTKARELFEAGDSLTDDSALRVVIDLPTDLDVFDADEKKAVERFLRRPEVKATKSGYVATNRRAWWSVGLRKPAPILATYMARRPPAFVRNIAEARHINIAHGVYPRQAMSEPAIARLGDHLRVSVTLGQGRTYAGGLTKFEPREMERLPVPNLEILNDADAQLDSGRAVL
ncbi:Methyltransferase domain-containing protein [Nocardioides exalbidus]|uniref:Methyltransferase domain-containing protein n=1 Tax=Nocardioides exalbidus TaxID=402596 RepID=A0A1H4S3D8_9ACTN|nr:N-6 DNA methylase [Nocardioides exalbidus]SEC38673.1 Methyltransferase domain-containing protein [Nocardioides exalbidus]